MGIETAQVVLGPSAVVVEALVSETMARRGSISYR